MVKYQKYQFKELVGEFNAVISQVTVEPNSFYKEEEENSLPENLTIAFDITDENGEIINHSQRYVSLLTGGNGLFQQLLDAIGYEPDEEGDIDEQQLVGTELIVSMGTNKGGYRIVTDARANEAAKKPAAKKKAVTSEEAGEVFDS